MPPPSKRKIGFRRLMVYLGSLVVAILGLWYALETFPSKGQQIPVELSREPMVILRFLPHESRPKAVILFASGDGGWGNLEEAIARTLQKQGYEILGVDSTLYAKTDYNLSVLQSDFDTIAQTSLAAYRRNPPPLIIGGYSMGAAQAIAAAGGPHPPQDMAGLLLIDPRSRGRYGLRSSDQLNVLPTGPGTFGMDEFAPAMASLRIVQWHAQEDDIDSMAWLDAVTAPHRRYVFPSAGHAYRHNRSEFLRHLAQSVGWILEASPQHHAAAEQTGAAP